MSDSQILTGLSIMVSGYSQLHCGLSIYHWQILVYLAWFCSITHLSCLTFLRNHLYNHRGERIWRLLGMGALIIMLIVALLPTGNNRPDKTPPGTYAICLLKDPSPFKDYTLSYGSMVVSIILLGLGFLTRVVKLHRSLSLSIVTRSRRLLSEKIRGFLHSLLRQCEDPTRTERYRQTLRLFLYRPALAIFLNMRVTSDLFTSVIFEVSHSLQIRIVKKKNKEPLKH